jgi:bZIP-type transcription factor MBZ1
MQRLGSAFWQAFSGSTTSSALPHPVAGTSTTPHVPAWDADKIRRVLEGTAVVRVVDVELPSRVQAVGKAGKNGTEVAKEAKEMVQQSQSQPACAKICASARETGLGVLEESMRALTLGKK